MNERLSRTLFAGAAGFVVTLVGEVVVLPMLALIDKDFFSVHPDGVPLWIAGLIGLGLGTGGGMVLANLPTTYSPNQVEDVGKDR